MYRPPAAFAATISMVVRRAEVVLTVSGDHRAVQVAGAVSVAVRHAEAAN
jgi:hypothetical protein